MPSYLNLCMQPKITSLFGIIYDSLCLTMETAIDGTKHLTEADMHSTHCLLLDECKASGYTIMVKGSNNLFYPVYKMTNSSVPKAIKFITAMTKTYNATAVVTGTFDSNTMMVDVKSIKPK